MKKSSILLFFLLSTCFTWASTPIDSLLQVLDKTIKERQKYADVKENQINTFKKELKSNNSLEDRYNISGQLFESYKNFQIDSALHVATNRLAIATQLGNIGYEMNSKMNVAESLGATGMYKEALDIMEKIEPKDLNVDQKTYYFHIYHTLYTLMADYSISLDKKQYYESLTSLYKDSLINVIDKDQPVWLLVKSTKLLLNNQNEAAIELAQKCLRSLDPNDHTVALVTYTLADAYNHIGNKEEEKKNLAISAISDLRAGIKEYISLRKLAVLLFQEGDINRAYNYTKCSLEDATYCNARLRTLEISQMLPIVNASYDLKMKIERERLIWLIVIISVLVCILIGTIVYIYRHLKILSRTRKQLRILNGELTTVNSDLNKLNKELLESNVVKEEYISYVFNICSTYIDKLEDFRKIVNRKLKTGQIEDLHKMTSSTSLVSDELKEFYNNFDNIFLNLYPNFIKEFNDLLIEDERVYPKSGDLLTPELRIFALVRLGINDSVKIASFLHYSPQTVYNYRLKIRNKAIVSKDDFSTAIYKIGSITTK